LASLNIIFLTTRETTDTIIPYQQTIVSTTDIMSSESSPDNSNVRRRRRSLEPFREPESPRSASPHRITQGDWLVCICVVSFDIHKGQFIEETYPAMSFDADDAKAIAFTSFPDINIGHGSREFVFNFNLTLSGTECHAASFFRQIPDASRERGSLQKSVVVLSRQPVPTLLTQMTCTIAPLYFEYGSPALEQALSNIESWPEARAGRSFQLPLSGEVLEVQLEDDAGTCRDGETFPPVLCTTMPRFPQQLVFSSQLYPLHSVMTSLWQIWELVLLQEPILIYSSTPCESSDAVLSVIDLISPLHYAGDCRPFLTANDRGYSRYFGGKTVEAVVGITNLNALGTFRGTKIMLAAERKKKENFKNGVVTDTKPLLKIDNRSVLTEISTETNPHRINEIIVRHFRGLTAMMLAPLDRYMTSLMPQRKLSVLQDAPNLIEFSEDNFIDTLSKYQIFKGKKSDEIHFYRRFIRTRNFSTWFRIRRGQARASLMESYLKEIKLTDFTQLLNQRSELLSIDLYVRMHAFRQRMSGKTEDETALSVVDKTLETIFASLPEDLRKSIEVRPPSPRDV